MVRGRGIWRNGCRNNRRGEHVAKQIMGYLAKTISLKLVLVGQTSRPEHEQQQQQQQQHKQLTPSMVEPVGYSEARFSLAGGRLYGAAVVTNSAIAWRANRQPFAELLETTETAALIESVACCGRTGKWSGGTAITLR